MGVPRLFPWLNATFPNAIRYFREGEYSTDVDYLYFDANGLLHKAAQTIFNYGSVNRKLDPNAKLSYDKKIEKVYVLFFDYMIALMETVRPNKVVYIAIDGPAPIAKQAQQRQRRFVAAAQRKAIIDGDETPISESRSAEFDSSSISPGTLFMNDLTRYINYRIRKELNVSYSPMSGTKVYFSPPTVPGEGEHKIMDFMRSLPKKERDSSSHCLFGPDGDLIMLTLTAHVKNMLLFREDQFRSGWLHIVDVSTIREELPSVMAISRGEDDSIDDFVMAGFFVGNDFLPKAQMFLLLEDGMSTMLESYSKTFRQGTLTKNGKVLLKGVAAFVKHVAESEVEMLLEQVNPTNPKKRPPGPKFVNSPLIDSIVSPVTGEGYKKEKPTLNLQKFKRLYYEKVGLIKNGEIDTKGLEELCDDYLRTMIWTFDYYVNGLPDWRWAYEHHYPPLMCDFSQYLSTLSTARYKTVSTFEIGTPSLPFEQLLSILPVASSDLLPKQYSRLMTMKESPLVKAGYYPETFKIDYEGKLKEYQGVALLPFVDWKLINKAFERMRKCCVKKGGYKRNKRDAYGKVNLFVRDDSYTARFTCDFGSIPSLHVKRIDIIE
jgi:5'-3' exonuclease